MTVFNTEVADGSVLNMTRLRRTFVGVRLGAALTEVDAIAAEHFDGNRSAALRRLLALGVQAWRQGRR